MTIVQRVRLGDRRMIPGTNLLTDCTNTIRNSGGPLVDLFGL